MEKVLYDKKLYCAYCAKKSLITESRNFDNLTSNYNK